MQDSSTQIINTLLDKHQITDPNKREFYTKFVLRESVSYFSQSVADVDFTSFESHARLLRTLNNKQQHLFVTHIDNIDNSLTFWNRDRDNEEFKKQLFQAISTYQSEARALTDKEVQEHLWQTRNNFISVLTQYRDDVSRYSSQPDHNPELAKLLVEDRTNVIKINKELFALGKSGSFSPAEIIKFKELFNNALKQIQKSRERVEIFNNPEADATAEPEAPKNPLIAKAIEKSLIAVMKTQSIKPEHQEFYQQRFGAEIIKKVSADIEKLGTLPNSPEFLKTLEREYQEIFKRSLTEIEPVTKRAAQYQFLTASLTDDASAQLLESSNETESDFDAAMQKTMERCINMLYRETNVHSFLSPLDEKIHRLEFLSDKMFGEFKKSILADSEYSETLKTANDTLGELFFQRSERIGYLRYAETAQDQATLEEQIEGIEKTVDSTIQNASHILELHINEKTQSYLSQTSKQLLGVLSTLQSTMQTELKGFQQQYPQHPGLSEIKKTIKNYNNSLSTLQRELTAISAKDLSQNINIDNFKNIVERSIETIDKCRHDINDHKKRSESQPELYAKKSFLNKILEILTNIWKQLSSIFAKAQHQEPAKPRGPMTFSNTNAEPSKNTPRPQPV